MSKEDASVKKRLLSPLANTAKLTLKNEMESDKENQNIDDDLLRLHDAVFEADLEQIKSLLKENKNLLFAQDDEGKTPIHVLCVTGLDQSVDILKLLLGVDEGDGKPAEGRLRALHQVDNLGFTPLYYSARSWFPELTEALLKYGASPAAQASRGGDIPLHVACEGNNERAIECTKLLLSYDQSGQLIHTKNSEELSPLHRAVKEQAVEMVKVLLSSEYNLDLTKLVSTSGQNILHYLCQEPGETDATCEILKLLLNSCSATLVNGTNELDQTVLHVACIERLPRFVEILVNDTRVDVLRTDSRKRIPLHYATENGGYTDGYQCVESLITRKFERTTTLIEHLFKMKDESENSPFMYACVNCPPETLKKYLITIREPQFWLDETDMALIYKKCPLAIKSLMDHAFLEKKQSKAKISKGKKPEADVIVADFGPITGYVDNVKILPQQETKYLKESHWWDFETRKEILTHPLVQLFVVKKCQKLKYIIYTWLIWQALWLAAYTYLILSKYHKVVDVPYFTIIPISFMALYITLSIFNEIFEAWSVGWNYIFSLTNWTQLIQIILGCIVISPVITGYDPDTSDRNCAAVGILLAYILSMRDIGKMTEEIGLVVEVLKQVVIQIVKVLLCCSPLLFGFTLAFVILFDDEESLNSTFPGPLVKVLVMMTGEFEYNDTFKTEESEKGESLAQSNKGIRLLLFLSFLICVPVAFFNLLTGFALDRVMELRERAEVGMIAKRLEHIYFIESILRSLNLNPILRENKIFINWLRNHNVTSAMDDGELKFETYLKQETRKTLDRRTFQDRRWTRILRKFRIFTSELPSDVLSKMFKLSAEAKHRK